MSGGEREDGPATGNGEEPIGEQDLHNDVRNKRSKGWESPYHRKDTDQSRSNDVYVRGPIFYYRLQHSWTTGHSDRTFLWIIENVDEKRKDGELVVSEYFYPKDDPYKLRLSLGFYGQNLEIRLLVYSGTADGALKWPLRANVTIKIINRLQPEAVRSLENYREMSRPAEKYFRSSDRFVFSFEDLIRAGLLQCDLLVVECYVAMTK